MTAGHKRKTFHSQDDVDHEHNQPRQSRLQSRITGLIERQRTQHQPPGLTSESLMSDFILHIWPEIRDDYQQMTQYLEEELKKVLKERRIDAEVSSRVKEEKSITKTLARRQKCLVEHRGSGFSSYQEIFHEMHDLSGLRIVLMNREDRGTAQKLIEDLFNKQKSPTHFDPNREVGQFWRRPWFGAYETHNHRVQLASDNGAALGDSHQWSGVMFEIQLTTFSDNLYNKLAHDLLYKADPGLVTGQEEMVIDVSHGLARCFELCMKILQPKLHRKPDNRTIGTAEDVDDHTEEEVRLAHSAVDNFEKDLHDQSKSDRTAQLLRKLLSKNEDAEDQACLKDLLVSDPRDDKARIEETKGGLLSRSYIWILEDPDFQRWRENDQNKPFWITGAPGKGKTMMLCGIINELSKQSGTNVSYSFCQGTDKRINTGTSVLRGLLFLLCNQQHSLISHIRDKYDNAGGKLFEDTNSWFALSGIFGNVLGDSGIRHTYLIVDALDECLPDSRQLLVKLILRMANAYPTVKWILSSRELGEFEIHLREATHLSLESRGESVSRAVNAYISSKLTTLGEQHLRPLEAKRIADELKQKSEGTFLWAAIVCKELESAQEYEVMEILTEMPTGLNDLYGKLVQDIKALKRKNATYCQSVLQTVTVAFRPLTLKELRELADLPRTVPAEAVTKMCRSLLTIRDDSIFFVHQSAKDYLSNEWHTVFKPSIRDMHKLMFSRSVETMEQILQENVYRLGHPGISIEDIRPPNPDPLLSVQYSCVYWITHLREAQPCSAEGQVGRFLRIHFLHWFEALSLIRSASACVYALRDLVNMANKGPWSESLFALARDMYRFAQSYGAIIEKAPLQAYLSALIFSPACSLTRMLFKSKEPGWIVQKPRVEQNWNSCLATLMGDLDEVGSVGFSPDGQHIVSGSSSGIIKIWDAESGFESLTIQGHTKWIFSVAFSEEGKFITSMSADATVKTWDAETGACISTCEDFHEADDTFTVSPDKRLHATAMPSTYYIHITDSVSNAEVLTLRGHSQPVTSIAFSSDGRLIASGSDDKTVKIWDAVTGVQISTLRGHNKEVLSVCFSPDAHRIASGSLDETIKIWDVESSAQISTLQRPSSHSGVDSVVLTLDGRRIASVSYGNTVKIWDVETGDEIREIMYEHGPWSVRFSPDGRCIAAKILIDTYVVSDAESGVSISTCSVDPRSGPVALSLGGRYFASPREDTVMIRDAESDKDIVALSGHSGTVVSLCFSPKDCHIVASAARDKTIKVWNVVSGAEISTLNMVNEVKSLRFDPTGTFLYALVEAASILPNQHSIWSRISTSSQTGIVAPRFIQHGYSVNGNCSWITWRGQNILWLPPELRNARGGSWRERAVFPHMISICCSSGRVWWATFSSEKSPLYSENG